MYHIVNAFSYSLLYSVLHLLWWIKSIQITKVYLSVLIKQHSVFAHLKVNSTITYMFVFIVIVLLHQSLSLLLWMYMIDYAANFEHQSLLLSTYYSSYMLYFCILFLINWQKFKANFFSFCHYGVLCVVCRILRWKMNLIHFGMRPNPNTTSAVKIEFYCQPIKYTVGQNIVLLDQRWKL